jgi:FdhE protein
MVIASLRQSSVPVVAREEIQSLFNTLHGQSFASDLGRWNSIAGGTTLLNVIIDYTTDRCCLSPKCPQTVSNVKKCASMERAMRAFTIADHAEYCDWLTSNLRPVEGWNSFQRLLITAMGSFWDKQIHRADQLAAQADGSKELVSFYAQLLRTQKRIYEFLRSQRDWLPSGDLELDLPMIRDAFPGLLKTVEINGPEILAAESSDLLAANADSKDELLINHWHSPSDVQFFAKAFLQPYGRLLADTSATPVGRDFAGAERLCPFCGGNPQVSFLRSKEPNVESGNRDLICATCLSSWEFRRVVCANCGEERPAKLGYFQSPEFDHVRIEACDTCKHYIKGVDLTRLGFAAPLVDEVGAAPLDLWAREHGYTKIELNLVGL